MTGDFYLAIRSALGVSSDPNTAFRMLRWTYTAQLWLGSPLFGIGFGEPLLPAAWIPPQELVGQFNAGMPHNTFLTVMAKMGLLGLLLIGFCWVSVTWSLMKRRGRGEADRVAVAAMLVAMAGFAPFVLFFERPIHNTAFWIVLGVGARLAHPLARRSVFPRHTRIATGNQVMA